MADPARARKLAVRIRQIVSAAIEMQVKDPRLGMVTVTDARGGVRAVRRTGADGTWASTIARSIPTRTG